MIRKFIPQLLMICLLFCTASAQTITARQIKSILQSPFFEKLYANTYYSLVNRMENDGYLQESLTGAYEGMFCRSVGPMVAMLIETGRFKEAELMIQCAINATQQYEMERIPHVIGKKNGTYTIISDEHQIDGQAHVVWAWAKLALKRGHTQFEDDTWPFISKIMSRTCDRTFLQTGFWSVETGLVRNISFEHSREGRRWDTWDLLTQSFVGGALKGMSAVAARRSEVKLADTWKTKLDLLKKGIATNLTTSRNGTTTYLEMRLPNSNGGLPYLGMGWVTLSPIAAEWEGLDHEVMRNTVKAMQQTMLKNTNGVVWMPTDSYPNGSVSNEIIGKGMGWELDFASAEKDYARIKQILDLIRIVNAPKPIYMEGGWLEGNGHKLSEQLSQQDLEHMKDAVWKTKDAGNGEQCAWWCWAMARLRREMGLTAMPKPL